MQLSPNRRSVSIVLGTLLVTAASTGAAHAEAIFSGGFEKGTVCEWVTSTPAVACAPALLSSSPADGEGDVSVMRETILTFDRPLLESSVTPSAVFAKFGGQTLNAMRHLSDDRKTLTLFYSPPLPASSRVRVTIDGSVRKGDGNVGADPDGDGQPGGTRTLEFDTLSLTAVANTAVVGRVFASELQPWAVARLR